MKLGSLIEKNYNYFLDQARKLGASDPYEAVHTLIVNLYKNQNRATKILASGHFRNYTGTALFRIIHLSNNKKYTFVELDEAINFAYTGASEQMYQREILYLASITLNKYQYQIFELRFYQGYLIKDIAKCIGKSEITVKREIRKIKETLEEKTKSIKYDFR
jgi:DNA-directed RNA polymerase specialized sigma24 family protein